MKRFVVAMFFSGMAMGQLSVVSTVPANNTTNVSLTPTITVTFNMELDTLAMKGENDWVFSNISSETEPYFSSDGFTLILNDTLDAGTPYFVAFIHARAKNGSVMTAPYIFYFTTGSAFPTVSVSGTVTSGTTGVSPENAIAGLALGDLRSNDGEGGPVIAMMSVVNSDGSFQVPYVSDGTYWPLAAKDVDGDGNINPDWGADVVALADSVIVSGVSLTGVSLEFMSFAPLLLSEALPSATSMAADLPSGSVLKLIQSYEVDTLGRGRRWEFAYYSTTSSAANVINIESSGNWIDQVDSNYASWIAMHRTLTNPGGAAPSSTVMANVEAAGGTAFRTQPNPEQYHFQIQVSVGDQNYGKFSMLPHDQNTDYWAVSYEYGYYTNDYQNWTTVRSMLVLCDFTTGAVLQVQTTGIDDGPALPATVDLHQNYPNPFNPATKITYDLPTAARVSLRVYDLLGREVATLVAGERSAGSHTVEFRGENLPSGVYMYRLVAGDVVTARKLILAK